MDYVTILGFAAAIILALALLPQVIKTYQTKSTKDISWGWVGCLTVGFSLFLTYGYFIDDLPIMFMNGFSLLEIIAILVMKLRYDRQ